MSFVTYNSWWNCLKINYLCWNWMKSYVFRQDSPNMAKNEYCVLQTEVPGWQIILQNFSPTDSSNISNSSGGKPKRRVFASYTSMSCDDFPVCWILTWEDKIHSKIKIWKSFGRISKEKMTKIKFKFMLNLMIGSLGFWWDDNSAPKSKFYIAFHMAV